MQTRPIQVFLLVFTLILAIFLLIAASKYAAWSHVMVPASGSWLPLIFYVATIPLVSLLYAAVHLAALQFNALPAPPLSGRRSVDPSYDANYTASTTTFILAISILHFLAWLAQACLCTGCELAPILAGTQGRVPRWCPQSRFRDSGNPNLADMLGTLATVKDFMQWVMVLFTIALIECARRESRSAEHARRELFRRAGTGVDFGGPRGDAKGSNQVPLTVIGSNISGPRILTPAEIAAQQRQQQEEEDRKKKQAEERRKQAQLPAGPGVPDNKPDNYYGNGMGNGLKRTKTLNYMYDTRI
ncbi:hypothetical protein PV08_11557 [Exophiala spinifera]|uniref:Uncharacterized protein n=1 Tax=Exophiala spinifera TaxID=91928 RepID=A0A0D2AV60_9EURO|nr:uncharacterized protein PV08_11557 [Exophiala spinifera]KIW10593.1 hypothetical protein PV08_11557 [Exophiala spinifera]